MPYPHDLPEEMEFTSRGRRRPRPSFGVFPVVLTLVVLLMTVVASFVALSAREFPINKEDPFLLPPRLFQGCVGTHVVSCGLTPYCA